MSSVTWSEPVVYSDHPTDENAPFRYGDRVRLGPLRGVVDGWLGRDEAGDRVFGENCVMVSFFNKELATQSCTGGQILLSRELAQRDDEAAQSAAGITSPCTAGHRPGFSLVCDPRCLRMDRGWLRNLLDDLAEWV